MFWWILAGLFIPGGALLVLTVWVYRLAGAVPVIGWKSSSRRRRRLDDAGFRPMRRKVDAKPAEGAP
jgi:hypothetical protein